MIPVTYKMIDLNGLDLAEINGEEVLGIYNKISSAYTTSRFAIMCNWKFADIVLAPAHVLITVDENNNFIINDWILVSQNDTIRLIGVIPEPVLVELTVTENGTYVPATGQDGFSEVNVNLSIPQPYNDNPTEDGVASPGLSSEWSRGDHIHLHDTSKLDISDFVWTKVEVNQYGSDTTTTINNPGITYQNNVLANINEIVVQTNGGQVHLLLDGITSAFAMSSQYSSLSSWSFTLDVSVNKTDKTIVVKGPYVGSDWLRSMGGIELIRFWYR